MNGATTAVATLAVFTAALVAGLAAGHSLRNSALEGAAAATTFAAGILTHRRHKRRKAARLADRLTRHPETG